MTIFERVKDVARQKGLTLRQVEEKAGLGRNSLYRWKNYTPRGSGITAVATVLDVSVDYLLGNTDEMHANKKATSNEPVDLDEVLSDEGIAMFDGQPLSEEYKKALLAMLNTMKGNGN